MNQQPSTQRPSAGSRCRGPQHALLVAAVVALLAGCGGGSDGEATEPSTPGGTAPTHTGRFIDGVVANLGYVCSGLTGVTDSRGDTDALGRFAFEPGQRCTFSIGGVMLGSGPAAALMTPASLVPGATPGVSHPTVTNMVRFLLSIDQDGNPDNGIAISAEAKAALGSSTLDFAASSFDTEALALVGKAMPGRPLVSASAAEQHLDLTLLGLYAGGYACTYRAVVGGTDTLLGNVSISIVDGVITGAGTPIGSTGNFELGGTIDSTGAANLTAGTTSTGATFTGSFVSDGSAAGTTGQGTWSDPEAGSGTWACQHS